MAIARIAPYPMPTEADLPPSVARWTPDAGRACLLVHDMQRYFVDALPAGRSPTTLLLANVARLVAVARDLGMPVLYTAQRGSASRQQRGLLHDIWGPGMSAEPANRSIVDAVAPRPGEAVLDKHRYSAFHGSDLALAVARAGRDQLIVCGVYAHVGCLLTACDAFAHDLETFFVADAMADFGPAEHRLALDYAARLCAVTLTADRLVTSLTRDRSAVAG